MRSSTKLKPVCLLWFKKRTNSIITTWIDWMTFMNWLQPKFWKVQSKILWKFPEIRGTPKSSMLIGFSLINQSFGVPRFMEPPLQAHRFSMVQLYSPWETNLAQDAAQAAFAAPETDGSARIARGMVLDWGWCSPTPVVFWELYNDYNVGPLDS